MFRTLSLSFLLIYFSALNAQTLPAGEFVQVHGIVVDSVSGQLLQATVEVLLPGTEEQLAFTDTNTEGHFGLVLNKGSIYDLRVKLEGYSTFIRTIDLSDASQKELELNILMEKKE